MPALTDIPEGGLPKLPITNSEKAPMRPISRKGPLKIKPSKQSSLFSIK